MRLIIKILIACIFIVEVNARAQELVIGDAASVEISPSAVLILSNGMSLVNNSSDGNLNGSFVFKGTTTW